MNLSIPDMSCGHCSAAVTRALTELDPACDIEINLEARQARVETTSSLEAVINQLSAIGFDAIEA